MFFCVSIQRMIFYRDTTTLPHPSYTPPPPPPPPYSFWDAVNHRNHCRYDRSWTVCHIYLNVLCCLFHYHRRLYKGKVCWRYCYRLVMFIIHILPLIAEQIICINILRSDRFGGNMIDICFSVSYLLWNTVKVARSWFRLSSWTVNLIWVYLLMW